MRKAAGETICLIRSTIDRTYSGCVKNSSVIMKDQFLTVENIDPRLLRGKLKHFYPYCRRIALRHFSNVVGVRKHTSADFWPETAGDQGDPQDVKWDAP